MEKPELNTDFKDFLHALIDARVEFIVVGAHALAAHGVPRATGDLDLFVEASRENAARLLRALQAFGAPVAAHQVAPSDFERPGTHYQMGRPPRRIDVLTSITGVSFEEARQSILLVNIEGMSLPVLGREALLKNKRATGRLKDLADVEALEAGEEA